MGKDPQVAPSGDASDDKKKFCFVIARIGSDGSRERDDLRTLMSGIRPILIERGFRVQSANEIDKPGSITVQVIEYLLNADLVIADLTELNPNVMYETGIAHALGKTVVPITQSLDDIPSDLGHHRALKYLPNEEGYRDLSNSLWKRFKPLFGIKNT